MSRKAPWPDFNGNDLYEGDTIIHPSGQCGKIIFPGEREGVHDQWFVDYGVGGLSRLSLQIGSMGQAVKVGGGVIKFIDIRGQGTGHRFAFWDTVTDKFLCISTEYAWGTWSDFEAVAIGCVDLDRYKRLCPDWVFEVEQK